MCGGDPYSLIVVRINLFVFSTCVEVILECDRPDYQGDSILHVCGGDPIRYPIRIKFVKYSPRVWR